METAAKIEAQTLRRGVLKLNEQMIKEDQMAHEALYVVLLFDLYKTLLQGAANASKKPWTKN